MLVMQWNGVLATWDLLRRQHEPVLTMQVCEEPLLRARIHDGVIVPHTHTHNTILVATRYFVQ